MISLLFKAKKEEKEFCDLEITDPRIRSIILEMAYYSGTKFKKKMIVTCVERVEQEQIKLYPIYWAENGKSQPSAHVRTKDNLLVRAVDVRTIVWAGESTKRYYELEEIQDMKHYFGLYFDRGYLYSFLHHSVKTSVEHIHIQVARL